MVQRRLLPQLDGQFALSQRLCILVELQMGDRQVRMRHRVSRLEAQRFRERVDGIHRLTDARTQGRGDRRTRGGGYLRVSGTRVMG